jgi:hypothetical protein
VVNAVSAEIQIAAHLCYGPPGAKVHVFVAGDRRCECGLSEPLHVPSLAPVPEPETGLLPDERRVMDLMDEVWNAWHKLPVQHPDEAADFAAAVHRVQYLLAIRIARRHYPIGWPVKAS